MSRIRVILVLLLLPVVLALFVGTIGPISNGEKATDDLIRSEYAYCREQGEASVAAVAHGVTCAMLADEMHRIGF